MTWRMRFARFHNIPAHHGYFFMRRAANYSTALLLCLFATLFALHKLSYPLIGVEDANIYFVYARNLANGHGFVYNIG